MDDFAREIVVLWDLPDQCDVRLLNISENKTYVIALPDSGRFILRLCRSGYHDDGAIESELLWLRSLRSSGFVRVPDYILGRDGKALQRMDGGHRAVLFEFLPGVEPDEGKDLVGMFSRLGEIAAHCHLHVLSWSRPSYFRRPFWDIDRIFGSNPIWGRWQDAPGLDKEMLSILHRQELCIRSRLESFGKSHEDFGLIHADMRLANLLVEGDDIFLIDFDDCGFGWFLYDFAAAVSFIEDCAEMPALKESWLSGYRRYRFLSDRSVAELDSFIMLRRMLLLAWIGSHGDTDLARSHAPTFASRSVSLAEDYLSRYG